MSARGFRIEFDDWADDDWGWDQDTGAPGIARVAEAIGVWVWFQNRTHVSVADAALAFNCDPLRVIESADHHRCLFVSGPRDDFTRLIIEWDGE